MLSWIRELHMVHRPSMTDHRRAQKGNIIEDHGRCKWRINWLQLAMYVHSGSLTQFVCVAIMPLSSNVTIRPRGPILRGELFIRFANCLFFSSYIATRKEYRFNRRDRRWEFTASSPRGCNKHMTSNERNMNLIVRLTQAKNPRKKLSRVTWLFAKHATFKPRSRSAHASVKRSD